MPWHIIEGAAGCAYAVEHQCVAIVVDALRASATAIMLLNAGAADILAVTEVEEAYAAHRAFPDALLAGERGGLPPTGFHMGNSPRGLGDVRGKRIIFTTTTGAGRLVAVAGAPTAYMGATLNADAVVAAAGAHGRDVVLIPAGLMHDPSFDAQEDWTAAAYIAMRSAMDIGEGAAAYARWRQRIVDEGVARLFETAPHADKLRAVGMEDDIAFCAQSNITRVVPVATDRNDYGVVLRPITWP